jgi:hypothetical protein
LVVSWGAFVHEQPELAAFGAERLTSAPAYMATVRANGIPRVHPIAPIVGGGELFVFMEPTSPKGRDLREGRPYALHSGVPDTFGSGGEFFVTGDGNLVEDPAIREVAVAAAAYDPEDRYILFTLSVQEARCNGYGDVPMPAVTRWRAP